MGRGGRRKEESPVLGAHAGERFEREAPTLTNAAESQARRQKRSQAREYWTW